MTKFKVLLIMLLLGACSVIKAESSETMRVYAELLGSGTNFLGLNKNVKVTVDMGQPQSTFKSYTLQDENGKDIKFNSMVAAMNYMGQRGWKFIQSYTITHGKNLVYHWLMYKDIDDVDQVMEGLNVKNVE